MNELVPSPILRVNKGEYVGGALVSVDERYWVILKARRTSGRTKKYIDCCGHATVWMEEGRNDKRANP